MARFSLKVNAALVQTMVASEGVSTPERVGGVVRMEPSSFTTQKLRRWKRFRPEILPLVPRMDLASALRAALFHPVCLESVLLILDFKVLHHRLELVLSGKASV